LLSSNVIFTTLHFGHLKKLPAAGFVSKATTQTSQVDGIDPSDDGAPNLPVAGVPLVDPQGVDHQSA